MKAPKAKVVRFELEHDDGSVWRLTGEAAARHVATVNRLCASGFALTSIPFGEPPWEIVPASALPAASAERARVTCACGAVDEASGWAWPRNGRGGYAHHPGGCAARTSERDPGGIGEGAI